MKDKIRANEEKLNKLVSVFLDGDIEREMYLKRKDLLMREKAGFARIKNKFLGNRERIGSNPCGVSFLSLKQASDLEKTSNHLEWKKFFRKSALTLKSRTKRFPYAGGIMGFHGFRRRRKGFGENQSAILASAKSLHILNSEQVTAGARSGSRTHIPYETPFLSGARIPIPPSGHWAFSAVRPGAELNRRIEILQISALPLGYQAVYLYLFINLQDLWHIITSLRSCHLATRP